jgi:hypothetical protein
MIRNTMLGLSLFALMTGSALAATPTTKHVSKPRTVATAPAADTAKDAPKEDAPKADAAKPEKKKAAKKEKAPKGDAAKTEMKSAPAPETK